MTRKHAEQVRAIVLAAIMVGSVVAMTTAIAGAAVGSNSTIVVDDSGGADYTTIQAAVDNADPGDTIKVKPGTYTEQVNIDKSLTLTSTKGPDQTTITKDDDSGLRGVIISTAEVTGLTIEGFTIKGTGGTHGIALQNQGSYENVTLQNNVVSGNGPGFSAALLWNLDGTITIANNEFTATADGINVQGNEDTGQKTDLVVRGNTFRDLGDNGAEFNAINNLTFERNTIKNYATRETAPGLEVAEDARIGPVTGTVTVTGNTITGGPVGIGIYPNEDGSARPLDISDNTLKRNDVHINDRTDTIDTATVLEDNTFDKHVVVDRTGSSLLPIIWGEIQGAVDRAQPGDAVEVGPGTYNEQVNIGTSLALKSTAGPEKTMITSSKKKAAVQTFRASVDVTIAGFTIKGTDGAAAFWSGAPWKHSLDENVTLRNNVLKSDTKQTTAAYVWGVSGNVVVDGNVFASKKDDGLNVDGLDTITPNVEVTNNVFENSGGNGAEFNNIQNLTFTGNTIKNYSTNEGETSAGLEIAEDGPVTGDVLVKRNTILEGGGGSNAIGIYDNGEDSRTVTIRANDAIDGNEFDLRHPGNGQFLGTQLLERTEIETTDPGLPKDLTLTNPSGDKLQVTVTTSGPLTGLKVTLTNAPEEGDRTLTLDGDSDGTSEDDISLESSEDGTYTYTATVTGQDTKKGATTYQATVEKVNGNTVPEGVLAPSRTVTITEDSSGKDKGKKKGR